MLASEGSELLCEPMITHNPPQETSWCYLVALTSFSFTAGLTFCSMGLVVLPAEVLFMWPDTQAATLGMLLALTGLSQLIAPAVGYLSDRCTHPLGRRRPYMLTGAGMALVGLLGMQMARDDTLPWAYAVGLLVSMLGMNCAYAAFTGLLPDIVAESMMGKASGLMAVLNAVGAALSFYIIGLSGLQIRHAYTLYALAVAGSVGLTALIAREAPLQVASPISLSEMVRSFRVSVSSHGDFAVVFWMRTTYYMGISVLSFTTLFLRDAILPRSGDNPALSQGVDRAQQPTYYTSLIAIFGGLGAAFVAVPVGQLSDRDGRKPYIYLSCAMMALVYIVFTFAPPLECILAMAFVYGVGNGSFLTVDYALAVDTLPDKMAAAKDLGLWGIAAFIGSSCGPLVLGPLLHVVGILALGGGVEEILGKTEDDGTSSQEKIRYGLQGYQAMLCAGIIFVCFSAYLLKFISRR